MPRWSTAESGAGVRGPTALDQGREAFEGVRRRENRVQAVEFGLEAFCEAGRGGQVDEVARHP